MDIFSQNAGGSAPSSFASKPVKEWTNSDVRAYAASIGLSSIDARIAENEVEGEDLLTLSEDEMKDALGCSKLLARKLKNNLPGSEGYAAAAAAAAAPPQQPPALAPAPPAAAAAPPAAPAPTPAAAPPVVYVINNTPAAAPQQQQAPPPQYAPPPPAYYAPPPPAYYPAPAPAPAPAAAPAHHGPSPGAALVAGVVLGSAMGRRQQTVIVRPGLGRRRF